MIFIQVYVIVTVLYMSEKYTCRNMPDLCQCWNYVCAILGFDSLSKHIHVIYIVIQMSKEENMSTTVYRYAQIHIKKDTGNLMRKDG